jgi:glucose-6-phosphate isomerase
MALSLDLSRMLQATGVAGGIAPTDWQAAEAHAQAAIAAFDARRAAGALGFLALPGDVALARQVAEAATALAGRCDDVVVLGIGGSSLGAVALRTALRPWGWNLLDASRRGGFPRLHVLDTPDPRALAALLDLVDLRRTVFLVISKSGGTAETLAQFLVVRERLEHVHGLRVVDHVVFVTDPEVGPLRAIARRDGVRALDVPANVGGRFSVLSPVGMLPAALLGIDTGALLQGAAAMAERCTGGTLATNPALAWATAQWCADATRARRIHVLMPYADALRDVAPWFVQLWAESLGKIRPDGTSVGPTPVPAVGPTDQHAQVQLFMEGPADKTVTFLAVNEPDGDRPIPDLHGEFAEMAYLGGKGLWQLVEAERRATAAALAARGHPSATMTLDRVDAWHVGGLLMWLQCATVYAGALYGIQPLDQPGVELGKRYTGALLGKPGADALRTEFEGLAVQEGRVVL